MSRVYTAQEMRDFADAIAGDLCNNGHRSVAYTYGDLIPVIEALRQSADAMEREEREDKREKKYEYSVHPADVYGVYQNRSAAELNMKVLKTMGIRAHLIRREVGEWEEVK